jgi:diguanylate cyclase (GGDEF)-like protein
VPHRTHIPRRCTILIALTLALAASIALAQSPAKQDLPSPSTRQPPPLRALTLHEAHSLSADEARRGYPVHVRAVVTYYDYFLDSRRIALFIHDSTGGIYAAVPSGTVWPGRTPLPGTLIDVSGISAQGDFAPILDQPHITILGKSRLPIHAKPVTLPKLLTGTEDGQWVEIEGVVRSVFQAKTNVTLEVATADGTIGATTITQPGVDYARLVDATVRIRGNAAPWFNSNMQMTGARLFFPGLETVTVLETGSRDVFALPVRPVDGLSHFTPTLSWPHRVHLRGIVTLQWPGRTLCIENNSKGLCAQTSQTTPLAVGSLVDVAGFTVLEGFKPALVNAVFQPLAGRESITAIPIRPEQGLEDREAQLVQIDGQLIGRDVAQGDTALILSSGPSIFRAILPAAMADSSLSAIRVGSKLRITGICSVQVDTQETLKGYGLTHASQFTILMQSPRSVVILQTPSRWTASTVGLALLLTLAITTAGFVWVFVLRRRVEQQTRELRSSRELYRHMAHHDALTGLPTRVLLQDRLQNALDRAQRFHKSIALLMLDLDKFKQINDSYGHCSGDLVLQIAAERIASTIRKTDSVARMGGDEFIVLLNDLDDENQAEQIAAKIVAALSVPIRIGKIQVPVSVSVGVCTLSDETVNAEALLRRVDAAMYRAKERGRCCFQVFTQDMIAGMRGQIPISPTFAASPRSETRTRVGS